MRRLPTPSKMTEDSQFQSREENGSRLHIIPLIFSIFAFILLTFIYFSFSFYLFLKTHNLLGLARPYGVEAMKVAEP
jgi:hypothetical protein